MIKAAVIKRNDGSVIQRKDHWRCIRDSPKDSCKGEGVIQGFIAINLTGIERFVDRVLAGKIAWANGQIRVNPEGSIIFSEEIWSPGLESLCYWDELAKCYVFREGV